MNRNVGPGIKRKKGLGMNGRMDVTPDTGRERRGNGLPPSLLKLKEPGRGPGRGGTAKPSDSVL